jgi:hypothetical protein
MELDGAQLFTALVVSSIGFGLFLYGKKQRRGPQLLAGVLLMLLPVLISSVWWSLGSTTAVLVVLWLAVVAGL